MIKYKLINAKTKLGCPPPLHKVKIAKPVFCVILELNSLAVKFHTC